MGFSLKDYVCPRLGCSGVLRLSVNPGNPVYKCSEPGCGMVVKNKQEWNKKLKECHQKSLDEALVGLGQRLVE